MKNVTAKTSGKYDLTAIMRRAWAIRKAAAAKIGCKVSDVVWGECLKMAWAEAFGTYASDFAASVIGEWEVKGEDGQCKMMTACIRKAAKNEIAYSKKDKYLQFAEVPAWYLRNHDLWDFISETWLRIAPALTIERLTARNEKRAKDGKRPVTLVSIVYNAARASIAAVYHNEIKHERLKAVTIIDEDGDEYSYFDTMEAAARDNTEKSAIIRADLSQFASSRDAVDQKILSMQVQGYTERQIGSEVQMSGQAVHKRIVKMRPGLREVIG